MDKMERRHHELKIFKRYYENIYIGKKTAELRENDKDFQVGDTVHYTLSDTNTNTNTDEAYEIKYVHSGLGLEEGFVLLCIVPFNCDED